MTNRSMGYSRILRFYSHIILSHRRIQRGVRIKSKKRTLAAAAALFAASAFLIPMAVARSNMPTIASADPSSGKVSDTVTLTGENLDKSSVVGVFLSDDKSDYKAALVSQTADKIVIKVPQVKSGRYNLSVQTADQILILPVRFTVEE